MTHLPSLNSWPAWNARFRIEDDEYVVIYDPENDDAWLSALESACSHIAQEL